MDVLANELFVSALTGHVAAMASEEEEAVISWLGLGFGSRNPNPNLTLTLALTR